MRIIIDAMGGDNAPGAIVRGAVLALQEMDISLTLVGDEAAVRRELALCGATEQVGQRFTLVHAEQILTMEDEPFDVLRKKRNSSMAIGLRSLADGEGDAFVCAGNTGALLTGATTYVRPHRGIRRAAIGTILPFERPLLLLDSGANVTVVPEYLEQFAHLGVLYMQGIFQNPHVEVGLLNNGTEAHKGPPVYAQTYQLLQKSSRQFVGNIEGKDIPRGKCDVLVADGFTGNIALKLVEGMSRFALQKVKGLFFSNVATKMSAILFKKQFVDLKKEFDASEYGGAPFLGISKPVIKAHGSSDARAVKNAIRQAAAYLQSGSSDPIAAWAQQYVRSDKIEAAQQPQPAETAEEQVHG